MANIVIRPAKVICVAATLTPTAQQANPNLGNNVVVKVTRSTCGTCKLQARNQEWIDQHSLTPAEVDRLNAVFVDFPAEEHEAELREELRWILGERLMAVTPRLTVEQVDRARAAFEAGKTEFVPQDVD